MAEYLIQDTTLDAIADAINAKTGGSSAMTPAEMVTEIGSIQTGGGSAPPFTFCSTSFIPVDDSNSITFSIPQGYAPVRGIIKIDGELSEYLTDENAGNAIVGVSYNRTGDYFGGRTGGWLQNDPYVQVLQTVSTSKDGTWYAQGVTINYNSGSGTFTISNTRGQRFLAGKTYYAWLLLAEVGS